MPKKVRSKKTARKAKGPSPRRAIGKVSDQGLLRAALCELSARFTNVDEEQRELYHFAGVAANSKRAKEARPAGVDHWIRAMSSLSREVPDKETYPPSWGYLLAGLPESFECKSINLLTVRGTKVFQIGVYYGSERAYQCYTRLATEGGRILERLGAPGVLLPKDLGHADLWTWTLHELGWQAPVRWPDSLLITRRQEWTGANAPCGESMLYNPKDSGGLPENFVSETWPYDLFTASGYAIDILLHENGWDTAGAGNDRTRALGLEHRAIALLLEHRDWSDTQIAKEVGCSRTTLYDWPKFKKVRAVLRSGKADVPRGRKDANGNIEAWE